MSNRLLNFLTAFVLGAAVSSLSTVAFADTPSFEGESMPLKSHTDVMEEAFFHDSNVYNDNITIERHFDFFFGAESFPEGNYPENEIAWDAELIHELYQDMMEQQNQSDPFIRVPDLPNPFNSSLRSNQVRTFRRSSVPYTPVSSGSEFVYDGMR